MKLLGRALNGFLLFLCLLLCAIPVAEFGRRGWERIVWMRHCTRCESGLQIMGVRLNQRLWKMFLGRDAKDLRVLPGNASTAVMLPPNGKWEAVDFLLPEYLRPESKFVVTSDSFGFRGAEQKLTPKTYRVLVLGSYQAFGHGVNDNETYSALLLERLKSSSALRRAGLAPVVWNGGMQSASLDRGIEVLKRLGGTLKPDLVILDYGMTDQVSKGMNPWLQPFAALADQEGGLYRSLDTFTRENSTSFFGKLYLFTDLVNRGMERNLAPNRAHWQAQAEALIRELKAKGTKVLLLDQPVAGMPAEVYQKVAAPLDNADFLSVKETLERAGASLGEAAPEPPWLGEFPAAFRGYFRERTPLYPYLGSILHINARGHQEIARVLADWVEKHGLAP